MTILVPGGAGYIGSHTVREIVDRGGDAAVVDNLVTGHRRAAHPKARFYQGDIRDRAFLDSVFAKEDVSAVIHFAASSVVPESMRDPLKYYDNNLHGTLVLLQAMLAHGVRDIVFSSTAATYGEPESVPIQESSPANPTNAYGETKLAMEKMIGWAARAADLRFVSLRYFNACGAHPDGSIGEDHRPESHLIPLILQAALGQREKVSVFGDKYPTRDGTCVRDYIHVCDLADAHIAAVKHLADGGAPEIINLGNGAGFTVGEVLAAAREVTGRPIPAEVAPNRPGDPAQLVASNEKARRILGFVPKRPGIADIIADAWKWHSARPEGFGAE